MATLRPLLLFGLLPLASTALTAQEVAECNAQVDLFDFEMNGGVFVELLLFPYVIVVMHVLIEEWYVPALELVTSPDFLDVPRPLIGCTIMAAGNCLPELSMSLAAVLLSDSQDIGTGEVFGSCVFDLLAILGVLGILAPEGDGIRLAPPLVLYFCAWAAIGTAADASLFFADLETMWSASLVMLALYLCFIGGAFVCWRLVPGFVGEDEVASRLSAAPKVLTLTAEATCAPGARGLVTPTAITAVRSAQRLDQRIDVTGRAEALHPTLVGMANDAAVADAADAMEAAVAQRRSPSGRSPSGSSYAFAAAGAAAPSAAAVRAASGSCANSDGVAAAPRETTPLLRPAAPCRGTQVAVVGSAVVGSAVVGGSAGTGLAAASEWYPAAAARAPLDGLKGVKGRREAIASRESTPRRHSWSIFDALATAPRWLFGCIIPDAHAPMALLGGRRPWGLTLVLSISYTLLLSYVMVQIATRAICLLGVRKNALGASVLTLAAGCPDLITAMVIARRPGMLTMAAANPFGAFAFNAFAALGLPWAILGTYADIFPPARGTWYPSLIGFCAIALALLAIFANQLRLTRALGVYLLILYALYLAIIINDSAMRPARPPA